MSLGLNY